jgi:hypothetical protein
MMGEKVAPGRSMGVLDGAAAGILLTGNRAAVGRIDADLVVRLHAAAVNMVTEQNRKSDRLNRPGDSLKQHLRMPL